MPQKAAEEERNYLQFYLIINPELIIIRVAFNQIQQLNEYIKYLPCQADYENMRDEIVWMNRPFSEPELCAIILHSFLAKYEAAYELHDLIPTNLNQLRDKMEKIHRTFKATSKKGPKGSPGDSGLQAAGGTSGTQTSRGDSGSRRNKKGLTY